jgi:hypothetical protein
MANNKRFIAKKGVRFLDANPDIIGDDATGVITISADINGDTGGNIVIHSGGHANADDIVFRTDTTTVGLYDASASEWNFQSNNITTSGTVSGSNLSGTNTGNEPDASTTVKGVIEIADQGEVDSGSSAILVVTPSTLAGTTLTDLVNDTTPQLGGPLDTNSHQVRWSKGSDVTSTAALALGNDGNYFDVTGATGITSIDTKGIGTWIRLHFDAILTITHNATTLVLPTGADVTTAAGDEAEFIEYAAGNWRCVSYTRADGTALSASSLGDHLTDLNALAAVSAADNFMVSDGAGSWVYQDAATVRTTVGADDAANLSTGVLADARVQESNVTQHEAALTILESQITDGSALVRLADTSTVGYGFVIDEDSMTTNSATKVPTQQSVKAYVDGLVSSPVNYQGAYDANTNSPALDTGSPSITVGDMYTVTVAGTFFTEAVEIGDVLIAEVTSSDAAALSDWTIVNKNVDLATTDTAGIIELATDGETNTGSATDRAITPANLEQWDGGATGSITKLGTIGTGVWEGTAINQTYLVGQSGTNTGDQTITLTGDVTGTGTGSFAATIAADSVTYAKMQNVVADNRILGNVAGAGGIVAELTAAQVRTMINVADGATADQTITLTGDVTGTGTGSFAATIAADSVTYAKIQNVVADNVILGNIAGAGGIVAELTDAQVRTLINVADGATNNTGALADLNTVGTAQIDDEAVTLAKVQHITTDSFLGRDTAGSGDVEVLSAATARGVLSLDSADNVTFASVSFGSDGSLASQAANLATVTETAIATWAHANYSGLELVVTAHDTVATERHITKIIITHDGVVAVATEYGTVLTDTSLATYDVDISGANIRLLATSASTNSTNYKVMATRLA